MEAEAAEVLPEAEALAEQLVETITSAQETAPDVVSLDRRPRVEIPGKWSLYGPTIAKVGPAVAADKLIFRKDGDLVYVRDNRLHLLTPTAACSLTERSVVWIQVHRSKEGHEQAIERAIKKSEIEPILGAPEFLGHLPIIEHAPGSPLPYLNGGSMEMTPPGYHEVTRSFCTYQGSTIRPMPVDEARVFVSEILADFCFSDEACGGPRSANECNMIAAMLTPLCPLLFRGNVPAFDIASNREGVGKGLVAEVIAIPALGTPAMPLAWSHQDEEIRKRLISSARNGAAIVHFDEASGKVMSPSLNAFLTTERFQDRVLGENKMIEAAARVPVLLTGNNMELSPDLARRSVPIRLHWPGESVDDREYRHPNLSRWAQDHREEILAALYGLIWNWHAKGCPRSALRFTTFDDWAATIGGILEAAEYHDLLGNREGLQASRDVTTASLRELVHVLGQMNDEEARRFSTADILKVCRERDFFPDKTGSHRDDSSAAMSLGHTLKAADGREFGPYVFNRIKQRPAIYSASRTEAENTTI